MSTSRDFDTYQAQMERAAALRKQTLPLNKTALFDALAAAGIKQVVVQFDGSGDSGQIEGLTARAAADSPVDLPEAEIAFHDVDWEAMAIVSNQQPMSEVIEEITYDLLGAEHGGWEIDDGAFGDVMFDVDERSITLDFNERCTTFTAYVHIF